MAIAWPAPALHCGQMDPTPSIDVAFGELVKLPMLRKTPSDNPWWQYVAPYEQFYADALEGRVDGMLKHNVTSHASRELKFILRLAENSFGNAPAGGRALDVGCGAGFIARAAADIGFSAIGIDLSSAAIELARRLHPGATFEVMDAAAPSFSPTERFALIIIRAIHPFMRSADSGLHAAILDEYGARLAPGGLLAILNPDGPARLDATFAANRLISTGLRVRGPVFPYLSLKLPLTLVRTPITALASSASAAASRYFGLGLLWALLATTRDGEPASSISNRLGEGIS